MIIVLSDGRYGNQLFLYHGLHTLFPHEKKLLFGFYDLSPIIHLNKKYKICKVNKRLLDRLKLIIKVIVYFRLLTIIEEHNSETYEIRITKGIISNIKIINNCYFQHFNLFKEKSEIDFKERLFLMGKSHLKGSHPNKMVSKDTKVGPLAFIHVRRGDYLTFPESSNPAFLDDQYYFEAITLMKKRVKNISFVVFSDDHSHVEGIFSKFNDLRILNYDYPVWDFALMSNCQHGILSASSFSWWAAYISRSRSQVERKNEFIAPKYWVGHRSKSWYPVGMKFEWITYI